MRVAADDFHATRDGVLRQSLMPPSRFFAAAPAALRHGLPPRHAASYGRLYFSLPAFAIRCLFCCCAFADAILPLLAACAAACRAALRCDAEPVAAAMPRVSAFADALPLLTIYAVRASALPRQARLPRQQRCRHFSLPALAEVHAAPPPPCRQLASQPLRAPPPFLSVSPAPAAASPRVFMRISALSLYVYAPDY